MATVPKDGLLMLSIVTSSILILVSTEVGMMQETLANRAIIQVLMEN